MGLDARKPVFGVSEKVRFKPACSATETSKKLEILLVASLGMILSKKKIPKMLIRLHAWAGWSVRGCLQPLEEGCDHKLEY